MEEIGDRTDDVARIASLDELGRAIVGSETFARFCVDHAAVLGEGNPRARLVLVGEAPGGQEERAGHPFVGPAGQILGDALGAVGVSRDQLWVTNVVKCRPTAPGIAGRVRNRAPTPDEVAWFLPWLHRELDLVAPRVIACLGATAGNGVLGRTLRVTQERGQWFDGPAGVPTMVTFHPAFLLRRTVDRDERYREFVADLHAAAVRAELVRA
ncbi:MAG TPA: uracil-DNA glycosylase [Thermomicrobiaceae bacterium]|nr:uracil-DNA glycosylase [Thermomicrobiaceae bacterium]